MTIPAASRIDRVSFFQRSRELIARITQRADTSEDEGEQLDAIHELEEMCEHAQSPLHRIEHGLGTVVSFLIMPIFALVNAGVVIDTSLISSLTSPLGLGVILGLFIGKQVGISFAVWLSVKAGIASMPRGVRPMHMYGVALLCGIGFTMALFVANLAFIDPAHLDVAKLGIIVGSALSAFGGAIVLRTTT
jgi:NhaA family Na+:H+ antiporter